MQTPMPVRLDAENQKKIDEAWDKALTPIDRFDHVAMLDAFLITHAYQVGVDKLTFHSEKKVAAGSVVMDIHYDRMTPGDDRFEVRIYDPSQKLLRQETYYRQEIEGAVPGAFRPVRSIEDGGTRRPCDAGAAQGAGGAEAHEEAVAAVFPEDKKPAPRERKRNPNRMGERPAYAGRSPKGYSFAGQTTCRSQWASSRSGKSAR